MSKSSFLLVRLDKSVTFSSVFVICLLLCIFLVNGLRMANVKIDRIVSGEEESAILKHVGNLNLKEISGHPHEFGGMWGDFYVLNYTTLDTLLKKIEKSNPSYYKFELEWKVQVVKSQYLLLDTSSFQESYPWWLFVETEMRGDANTGYLVWWDKSNTRYTLDQTWGRDTAYFPKLEPSTFNDEELPIKWIHASRLYFSYIKMGAGPHGSHVHIVNQLIFLDENLRLVCFVISTHFFY
ncbi:MAG: hypothetical protein ACFFC7_13025 [Candidatus Hermodarchaeota archaeon]